VKCGEEYWKSYLLQLINNCLKQENTKAMERILSYHYIKKKIGKILEIIGESVSIVDCLPRLSIID